MPRWSPIAPLGMQVLSGGGGASGAALGFGGMVMGFEGPTNVNGGSNNAWEVDMVTSPAGTNTSRTSGSTLTRSAPRWVRRIDIGAHVNRHTETD